MSYSPYCNGVDLSKPIPPDLCKHNLVEKSNIGCGGKCPNYCIKCGATIWLPRKRRMSA